MGIFKRITDVLKANITDLISKAEDPERMLPQIIEEMEEQYRQAKVQVARAIADEKRLQAQAMSYEEEALEWERRAMLAVQKDQDDLAKEALSRKRQAETSANLLKRQWEGQKEMVEKLKVQLRGLEAKIEEARRKKNLLLARAKRAEALKSINQAMAGLSDTSAFSAFDRMAEKVATLEAEAQAAEELTGQTLENRFRQLEAEAEVRDEELLALKAKMGKLPPERKELPPASVEEELQALKAQVKGESR
ncbi:MAG: PspA/IM30 family protein [Candidatus Methylomirabilales bacterium]